MSKDKQIEEIARPMCNRCKAIFGCKDELCPEVMADAEVIYNAGYRKQSRGEWVSVENDVIFKCSICEAEISTSWDYENDNMFAYCPCCGAKMKGV